ncbi:iron ABC transporter permease [Enterococcus gallinarum]|nr:iron ABC transporter permease [Enterococcus gallinarum]
MHLSCFPHYNRIRQRCFLFLGAFLATSFFIFVDEVFKDRYDADWIDSSRCCIEFFFSAISQVLSLQFDLNQDLAFWFIGGAANVTWTQLQVITPIYLVALFIILGLGKSLNLLAMGDETAISLGKHPERIRLVSLAVVVLLAGMAVSLVGPVSFIGLMVPHVIRGLIGKNYQMILPLTIVAGEYW